MDFYPVLENERVLLRPLQAADVGTLWEVAQDPGLWRIAASRADTKEALQQYIAKALQERDGSQSIPFLIFDKRSNRTAGSTRFLNIVLPHKRMEIGATWIGKEFQGTGLNKQAKLLLLEYAFEVAGMNRVELKTDERNLQSQHAMLSIGAKKEGILRSHMITEDGWLRNSVYFSIIKEEWPEVKEQLRKKCCR